MEQIINELRTLSLEDIRQQLIDRGEEIGPLMPTMRHLFEKKLARRIMKERGIVNDEEDTVVPDIPVTSSVTDSIRKTECVVNSEEYFAISLPKDIPQSNCEQLVFDNRKEAMSVLKKFPGSRFKKFSCVDSAKAFTTISAEDIVQSPRPPPPPTVTTEAKIPEKKSEQRSFREPNRADRIKLKEAVEAGDVDSVNTLIWSNPHYLISVGETPVVLHEAFRYNSLHLAAKFNRPEVCRLILNTVSNPEYHQLLFSEDSDITRRNRIEHMLDLFLNMPDRGSGDSAVHFACKFGHADVVEVLVGYPQCDRNRKNKMGDRPCDVINFRVSTPDQETAVRIKKLLDGMVYVPLYRTVGIPVIGQPIEDVDCGDRTLRAYAGPMPVRQAEAFRQSWVLFPPNSPRQKQQEIRQTKRSDYDKGLERLGRDLADDYDVSWSEYWEFLNDFTNFRTPEGLQKLDNYLAKRAKCLMNDQDLNGNCVGVGKRLVATVVAVGGSGGCSSVESSPSNGDSPSDMTLLSYDFQKLNLNDSLSSDGSARRTLDLDSDSDSDDYISAPSSPSQPISIATDAHHSNKDDLECDGRRGSSSDSEDEFRDAEDFVEFPAASRINSESRDRDDVIFLDGRIPTKLDLDVYRAVGDISVKELVYPYFARWRRSVTSYSANEQKQWPSPARVRRTMKPLLQSPLATPTTSNATPITRNSSLAEVKSKLVFQ